MWVVKRHIVVPDAVRLCWWVVGIDTTNPGITIDLYNDEGDLICEIQTFPAGDATNVGFVVAGVAEANYIHPDEIHYDDDRTEFYAET